MILTELRSLAEISAACPFECDIRIRRQTPSTLIFPDGSDVWKMVSSLHNKKGMKSAVVTRNDAIFQNFVSKKFAVPNMYES